MVTIQFLGHACFTIADEAYSVIIDPFLSGNPVAATTADSIKTEAVLLTHGHSDHIGDTEAIAKANDALVVSVYELANYLGHKGLTTHPMHIGGSHEFPFGKVKFTPATHGSAAIEEDETITYLGNPAGIILTMEGKTIYHSGDTGLFLDMQLIGSQHLDCAMLPIGDNFTMGIDDAVEAVKMLRPKTVIPMHYNTWELIQADPHEFAEKVAAAGSECVILEPGQSHMLE